MLSLEKKCRGKRSVVSRGKIPVVPIAWHREGNHVHKADPHCSFQAEGKDNVLPGLALSMVALKTQLLLPALSDLVWPRADLFEGVGQEPPKVTSRLSDPVPHGTHRVPHASITQPSWCVTNLWHSWLPARVQSHFPAGYMILRRTLQEEDPQADHASSFLTLTQPVTYEELRTVPSFQIPQMKHQFSWIYSPFLWPNVVTGWMCKPMLQYPVLVTVISGLLIVHPFSVQLREKNSCIKFRSSSSALIQTVTHISIAITGFGHEKDLGDR